MTDAAGSATPLAMPVRAIPPDMSPAAVATIDALLARIRAEHGVAIPLAVESGSRAWGFPSPDSDYDCRFIYVRPLAQHLTTQRLRDVIELPIAGEIDVNGWDLAKALRLILKGNAVVVEWLQSPIVYTADEGVRAELLAFAEAHIDRTAVASHYRHFAERQIEVYLDATGVLALKKIFYILRPAMALNWMRRHPAGLPPMHFPTLLAEGNVPRAARDVVDDLLARKAVTREMGAGPMPAALLAFVRAELDATPPRNRRGPAEGVAAADALYRAVALRLDAAR